MAKKVFIIHGWEGFPEECWFIWLKDELEKRGYQAFVPQMPNTDEPKIEEWVGFLKKLVKPDEETYFVAHSIGCQAVMRYLESLPAKIKIGGALFVGPWFTLTEETSYETKEDKEIAKPWIETPIDFKKVKKHTTNFSAIFSDNDPFVPLSDSDLFKERLGTKITILHNKHHMGAEANMKEFPEVLKEFLKLAK